MFEDFYSPENVAKTLIPQGEFHPFPRYGEPNTLTEAQKTAIKAEAQAEANKKIAESLSEALIEYQKIQKWDGKLPTVTGSTALVGIDAAE